MDNDLNLLFGVFAVQLRKVMPAQLMEAASAWAIDPSRSLAARLVEINAMGTDDANLIRRLVNEAVAAHNGDVAATLRTLGGDHLVEQTFAGAIVPSRGPLPSGNIAEPIRYLDGQSIPGVQETPGRYTHVSEYGRGGMGRVLLVHDAFLGRDVAFKELLPGPTPKDPESPSTPVREYMGFLARFLQEARITGQLEHPSIVPVYELGHRSDGRLYYTMKLVRGKTLRQAMNECKTLTQRLTLLSHFVDLCHAIAYAHSRRIIHRDIKPDNVMVGEFGETVVLDWGLAKSKDSKDFHADGLAETFRLLHLGEVDSAAKTQYGQVMGTPAYMPPEQALGKLDWIDELSDVYSLGAVFYELLSGNRPFYGETPVVIIKHVLNDEPAPLDRTIPPELRAICMKAMQKKPQQRYPSAAAMADEVRRFLSGALVQTYAYGWKERLARAFRRHKAVALTATAALLILAFVGATSYVRVVRERDIAVVARKEAEEARSEAVLSRDQTEYAVYRTSLLLAHALSDKSQYDQANETLWNTPRNLRNWEWGYLLGLCNRDRQTFSGHSGPVLFGSFSRDGSRIVTCGLDGTAKIWEVSTGALVRSLLVGSNEVTSAEFSPNGELVLTAERSHTVQLWNAATGDRVKAFGSAITDAAISARFNHAGTLIAAPLLSNTIVIWDIAGEKKTTLAGHRDSVWRVAFSPDGARLASASSDGTIKIWDVISSKELATLTGHEDVVRGLAFSPSGRLLVSASYDKTARTWDMSDYHAVKTFSHPSALFSADFDPTESQIITGGSDKIIRAWDISNETVVETFEGHSETVSHVCRADSGTELLSCGFDGKVKLWSLKGGSKIWATQADGIKSIDLSPDASKVILTLDTGTIQVRDAKTGHCLRTLAGVVGRRAEWSSDGRRILVHSYRGESLILDWDSFSAERIVSTDVFNTAITQFTSDGKQILAAGFMGDLTIFDVHTGKIVKTIVYPSEVVSTFQVDLDNEFAVTGTETGDVILWDINERQEPTVMGRHSTIISAFAFDFSGTRLASGSTDGEIKLWDVRSKKQLGGFKAQVNRITSIVFCPDGSRLAAASADQSVCIWDTGNAEVLLTLTHSESPYTGLSWSLDGTRLAVSAQNEMQIWEASPWRQESLPGDASSPWVRRFEQFKRDASLLPDAENNDSTVHKVIITPQNIEKSLRRAVKIMEQSSGKNVDSGHEAITDLSDRRLRETFGYFGLESEYQLAALDGVRIDTAEQGGAMVDEFLNSLSTGTVGKRTMTFAGPEGERSVEVEITPQVIETRSVTLPRMLASLILKQGIETIDSGRATAIEYARMYSANFDLPVFDQEIDGFWVDKVFTSSRSERQVVNLVESFYKTAGIQFMDHVVGLNGIPLSSMDVLIEELKKGLGALDAEKPFTFKLDVERGRFHRVTILVHIT
ncbi:MAG: protein kinase [Candidatus Hydrogenedentes bacterium]|nr:protein kinase [Candidatus Hydrogenedentota bacterium]